MDKDTWIERIFVWFHDMVFTHGEFSKPNIGTIYMCTGKYFWNKGINFTMYPAFMPNLEPFILEDLNEDEIKLIFDSTNLIRTYLDIKEMRGENHERGELV